MDLYSFKCFHLNSLFLQLSLLQVSHYRMDQADLRDLIPPKQQNPLLKRKPLNLGNRFVQLKSAEHIVEFDANYLTKPTLTLLFFAGEWCNICKPFIVPLKTFYEEVNLQEKKIEIIYVGFDKVKKDYEGFTKTMPWVGLPFADQKIQGLKEFYDIRSIPRLILLDNKGEEVANDCRGDVYNMNPDDALLKWIQLRTNQQKQYYYENPA